MCAHVQGTPLARVSFLMSSSIAHSTIPMTLHRHFQGRYSYHFTDGNTEINFTQNDPIWVSRKCTGSQQNTWVNSGSRKSWFPSREHAHLSLGNFIKTASSWCTAFCASGQTYLLEFVCETELEKNLKGLLIFYLITVVRIRNRY